MNLFAKTEIALFSLLTFLSWFDYIHHALLPAHQPIKENINYIHFL